jgi:hypothetical protein
MVTSWIPTGTDQDIRLLRDVCDEGHSALVHSVFWLCCTVVPGGVFSFLNSGPLKGGPFFFRQLLSDGKVLASENQWTIATRLTRKSSEMKSLTRP